MTEQSKIERTRTINWEDPTTTAREISGSAGLDYLTKIKEGAIKPPPAANLIGYRIVEVGEGFTIFELIPEEFHYNPFSSVHGGIASVLLDSAMTSAVLTKLDTGMTCSTIEIKVNFIRPFNIDTGPVRCFGNTIHVGKHIATAEGKLIDRREKLYAHGVNTCMIRNF